MAILNDEMKGAIKKRLDALPAQVKLVFFKTNFDCETCDTAEALADDLASLSEKLVLETHNLRTDEAKAAEYGIDKVPAYVVEGLGGNRVRFYGLPAGYEFASFLESLKDASVGKTELAAATRQKLSGLKKPAHIQVFVTPTCPYCPGVVRTAHKLALESPQVTADMIEVEEFPDVAGKYQVGGVPKVVINDSVELLGARSEAAFMDAVLQAAGSA